MASNNHFIDDKITLRELILRMRFWSGFFLSQWKFFLLAGIIGAALGALASWAKKPVYHASTSFVLEESDMSSLGQMSGLASLVGVNLGSFGGASGLFQGDNILELYKSDNMLAKTLLSPFDEQELLIERFISFHELEPKWKKKVDLSQLDFRKDRSSFTIQQDSVVKVISKMIRDHQLSVEKPNRKLTIIQVNVSSKDEKFAKVFNERLVENVNTFYYETKTKKTAENLQILQHQADSVRRILDENLLQYAAFADRIPNANPLMQTGTVEGRKRQIDIQATSAIYAEVVKNLEIAKVNHRNNSPLIQLVDEARYPIPRSELKLSKGVVLGGLIAVFLVFILLYVRKVYELHVQPR